MRAENRGAELFNAKSCSRVIFFILISPPATRRTRTCARPRNHYIHAMMRLLIRLLQLPLALIVMFYEWGWTHLSHVFVWLARRPLWAKLEAWMARLPPYAALLLFILPSLALFPVKLSALWLVSHGQKILGLIVIIAAKIVGTAVIARIFTLTQPALMQLKWFARFYNWFKPWKDGWMAMLRASAPWRAIRLARAKMRRWGQRITARFRKQ